MTRQAKDSILINGLRHFINYSPMYDYWRRTRSLPPLVPPNTAMYRGFRARWAIEDKKLFLIEFYGCGRVEKENGESELVDYSIESFFPGQQKVFADWFVGPLEIPMGEVIGEDHIDGDIYESSTSIFFIDGVVTDPGLFVL